MCGADPADCALILYFRSKTECKGSQFITFCKFRSKTFQNSLAEKGLKTGVKAFLVKITCQHPLRLKIISFFA